MPITKASSSAVAPAAKGDLVVGNATNDSGVLAVGSANQVLTVDSSTATGLKWATASAGALTKITSGTFSNVASVTVDNVFSSTYLNYMLILNVYAASYNDDLHMQLRYGSTTKASQYYNAGFRYSPSNALNTFGDNSSASVWFLTDITGDSTQQTAYTLYFNKVGNASENPNMWGNGIMAGPAGSAAVTSGWNEGAQTYTGFLLKSSASNITGKYQVYGLEN